MIIGIEIIIHKYVFKNVLKERDMFLKMCSYYSLQTECVFLTVLTEYSAQAGEKCYKRSGSEAQFTDCTPCWASTFVQIIQLQPDTTISIAIATCYDADGYPF